MARIGFCSRMSPLSPFRLSKYLQAAAAPIRPRRGSSGLRLGSLVLAGAAVASRAEGPAVQQHSARSRAREALGVPHLPQGSPALGGLQVVAMSIWLAVGAAPGHRRMSRMLQLAAWVAAA